MNLIKRIAFFALINIGLIVSISLLVFLLERFLGIRITPSLADGYTSLALYSLVFGFASAFLSLAISRMTAKWMYSVKLLSETRLMDYNAKTQLVYTTVAGIAKQKGIDMPEVGIYESDDPNAFATGPTKNRALVAVSTGLLAAMTSAEIEGVVAHEMSHVWNGDMVTMTLLQGVLNVIVIFASRVLGSIIANAISRDRESPWLEFIVTMVIQVVLGFAAMMVLAAFSRYREYRADEGSARFVGKQKMIASLRKLSQIHDQLAGHVPTDERVAAFQITSYKISYLFSTHPPLEKRIKALEERYDLG